MWTCPQRSWPSNTAQPSIRLKINGELVVYVDGRLSFDALQRRRGNAPASYVAFDLLAIGGVDLRTQRWKSRRARLEGILHRDVKPPNVLLSSSGEVLLADFGIAIDPGETAVTATGMFVGSAEYMAPERLRGSDTPASDLFSLGVTLYHAIEGVSPFRRRHTG